MERPCAGGGPRPRPSSRAFARDRRRCSSSSCFARCLSSGQASRFTLCPPPSSPELCAVSARKRCLVKKRGTVGGVSVSSTVESGEALLTTLRSGDSDFLRCVAVADKRSLRGLQLPSFRGISRWGSDAWRTDERLTVCSRTRNRIQGLPRSGPRAVTFAAKNMFFWGLQETGWYVQVQKSVVNFVLAQRNTIQIESADRPHLAPVFTWEHQLTGALVGPSMILRAVRG